jgi:hypothetical protein
LNNDKSYKTLGNLLNTARLSGLVDWNAIEDRTRNMKSNSHWKSPGEIVAACANQFQFDKWKDQPYHVECFSPDTQVTTREGFVSIASLEVEDEVLTHLGRYRKVTRVICNPYEGSIFRIKATGLPTVGVTPGHPTWVKPYNDALPGYKGKRRKFLESAWLLSESIKQFDMLTIPLCVEDFVPLPETTILKGGTRSIPIKDFGIDEQGLKVCGLYVAEGSVRGDKRTVQFTFDAQKPEYAQVILEWAERFGIPSHTVPGAGVQVVYLFSKALADWFTAEFGSGAYEKRLPLWITHAKSTVALLFLEYYFRGDGCLWDESAASLVVTTRSQQLAQQVQMIFLQSGYICGLSITQDHGAPRYNVGIAGHSADCLAGYWGIRIPHKNNRYNHSRFTATGIEVPVQRVETEHYEGLVYNLEVEEDHTYCVPFIVHNCFVEKDALVGVIEAAARPLDISFFSCRGYMSQSEMWVTGQRLMKKAATGKKCLILHLGDHDPSGVDMSRDITERIRMFWTHHYEEGSCRRDAYEPNFEVRRLALNWDQVQQYNPPPNPTKLTDTRSTDYIERFGHECWELDALEPSVIRQLIEDAVLEVLDQALWDAAVAREKEARGTLRKISTDWDKVTKLFGGVVTEAFKAPEEDWVVFKVRFDDMNEEAEDHYRDCHDHLEEALEMGLGLDTDEYHIEWYAVGEFEVTIKREVEASEVYDMLTSSLEGQEHEIEITGLEM